MAQQHEVEGLEPESLLRVVHQSFRGTTHRQDGQMCEASGRCSSHHILISWQNTEKRGLLVVTQCRKMKHQLPFIEWKNDFQNQLLN